jgi:acyl-CoA synthetase (NDP forming)
MTIPDDLGASFRELIPPFGAFGNPIDLTGGEPPETYRRALRLALQDDRVDAIALGYWHTILTPPLTFARLVIEVLEETRGTSRPKPVVASLMGDVEVEEACPPTRMRRSGQSARWLRPTTGRAARGRSHPRHRRARSRSSAMYRPWQA